MSYYVGDIPSEPIILTPEHDGDPVDLTVFNDADVELRDSTGALVTTVGFTVDVESDAVQIDWPDSSPFAKADRFALNVTLLGAGVRERLDPVYLVVDGDDGWTSTATARAPGQWADAPRSDARLWELLEVGKVSVLAFAPALAADAPIPLSYATAQLMQARNVWNMAKVDPASGGFGDEDTSFVVRPYPLDWGIRQILRPKRALGAIA